MPDETRPDPSLRHVFVYGTLRRTGRNDITRLQPAPRFIGAGRVAGVLYHLGAYPGMVLGGGESPGASGASESDPGNEVQGEVFAIEPALELVLDEIEGLGANPTDEYIKREITVQVQGQALCCLVYEINPRYVVAAPAIAHGDWLMAIEHDRAGNFS